MEADIGKEYSLRFAQMAAYRASVWKILTREFFSRWIPAASTILDLGCGWGEFINHVEAARKYGMDLNPDSPGKLASEVTFFHQDCSQRWPLPDASLDVVFTSNFFEHLPSKDALRRTLDEVLRCLKPGGRLICLGPNIRLLPGRYWDFWDHYIALSDRSLAEILQVVGYEIEDLRARFLPFTMSEGFAPPLFFLRAYLRIPLAWRLLGKQFLVIARKPS